MNGRRRSEGGVTTERAVRASRKAMMDFDLALTKTQVVLYALSRPSLQR